MPFMLVWRELVRMRMSYFWMIMVIGQQQKLNSYHKGHRDQTHPEILNVFAHNSVRKIESYLQYRLLIPII